MTETTTIPKTYIIQIYASWCGACQSFKPDWDKFKKLNENNEHVHFDEIEESEFNSKNHSLFKSPAIGKLLSTVVIPHYPTIIKITNGKIEHFNKDRTLANIAKWTGHQTIGGMHKRKSHNKSTRKSKKISSSSSKLPPQENGLFGIVGGNHIPSHINKKQHKRTYTRRHTRTHKRA